jgi:hypothetical protein
MYFYIRKKGGQCIPLEFLKDNQISIDCLDGSDEMDEIIIHNPIVNIHCSKFSTFRCEERIGQYFPSFQCGDGSF